MDEESLGLQEEVAMQRRSETYGEATLWMGWNGNEWSAWSCSPAAAAAAAGLNRLLMIQAAEVTTCGGVERRCKRVDGLM